MSPSQGFVETAQVAWWSIASTVGSAAATVAVGIFAAVELWATRTRRQDRERATSARLAAVAFLARRQLRSWLGPGAGSADGFEEWIRASQNAGALARHLDTAEARFIEMLALGADAKGDLHSAVQSAAVHFFEGANRLNTFVSTPQPRGIDIADWVQLRNDAWTDFRDCVHLLDDKVGAHGLILEARLLEAKRRSANPSMDTVLDKLADGLAKLHEDSGKRAG